jgi:hypothetical protein
MKKAFTAGGLALLIGLGLALAILRVVGFEPRDRSPGFWIQGTLVTTPVVDWAFTDQFETVAVETRTWYLIPHSVTTFCTTYDGQLYLTSTYSQGGEYPYGRTWNRNVVRDPRVRLKIGDQVFESRLLLVTDETEKEAVLQRKMEKYPDWKNPGADKVHTLRVLPR